MADEDEARADFDTEDLGEPIAELRELEEIPDRGFVGRLMNSLRRRDLSSQVATLSWNGLGAVLLEFLKIMFAGFSTTDGRHDERGDGE